MSSLLDYLRDDQKEIVGNSAPIKCIACGRRWGKTYMSAMYAMTVAEYGGAVAWVAPTYKNSRPLWRQCEQMTAPIARRVKINRAEREIEFPSRGRIGIYSADNDVSIRGEAFDLVIVDEAAQVKEETFADVILPTIADRDGRILLISTPKGRNWFWREWMKAHAHGAAWNSPTSANPSPQIRRAAELAQTRVSDRTYRQEWLAEFIDEAGQVFRNVREMATLKPQEPQPDGKYIIGVDWARHNDATVFCVLDIASKRQVFVDAMTDTPYELQLTRLAALQTRYNNAGIIAESNGIGDPIIERAGMLGINLRTFQTSDITKAHAVDQVAGALERGELALLDDEAQYNELVSFENHGLNARSVPRYAAPDGLHDDYVMALCIAYSGMTGGSRVLFEA